MTDSIAWYDAHADALAARYEAVAPEQVHDWLQDLLPSKAAAVLDVGAGSGRDAAWLASQGHDVVAVEPSSGMRKGARKRHAERSVQWLADALPGLDRTFRTGLAFDVILLSAVWMHVAPADRAKAFRRLITLLKPGGLLAITLRSGPAEPERGFHPVSSDQIRMLARDHGALVQHESTGDDHFGCAGVRWTNVAIRLPDDGTDALPLLRHVILNDNKSTTYKLGLIRTLCRIADGAAGLARPVDDAHVAIPMGLVALTWLRLYKPLLGANLPQSPLNRAAGDGLAFAKDAFRKLEVGPNDMRVGLHVSGDAGATVHQALKDAARTIAGMPVRHMTYPDGASQVLTTIRGPVTTRRPADVRLDEAYLASFGEMRVPMHLWTAIQRFAAWIEPALIAEWTRLMTSYAERQQRPVATARIDHALAWGDRRDVGVARERAEDLLVAGSLHCVWSGRRLSTDTLDIDHCFPWTVWPCGDLWNLMPTHRIVNQREKRDGLPAAPLLRAAHDRILDWWNAAYRPGADRPLAARFALEAAASLPGIPPAASDLDSYHGAMSLQRLRLKRNQQAPEWKGHRYVK